MELPFKIDILKADQAPLNYDTKLLSFVMVSSKIPPPDKRYHASKEEVVEWLARGRNAGRIFRPSLFPEPKGNVWELRIICIGSEELHQIEDEWYVPVVVVKLERIPGKPHDNMIVTVTAREESMCWGSCDSMRHQYAMYALKFPFTG